MSDLDLKICGNVICVFVKLVLLFLFVVGKELLNDLMIK